jgi:hypothetical protein
MRFLIQQTRTNARVDFTKKMKDFYAKLDNPKQDYFDKVQLYQRRFDTERMIFLQSDIRKFKEELARMNGQLE